MNTGKTFFMVWDIKEKAWLPRVFNTRAGAERYKTNYLDAGNYPDEPHTVLQVLETRNGDKIVDRKLGTKKITKGFLEDNIIGASSIGFLKGQFIFRKGYFYRNEWDSEKYAKSITSQLKGLGIEAINPTHGDHHAAFRGGQSTRAGSHFWFRADLEEAKQEAAPEKINLALGTKFQTKDKTVYQVVKIEVTITWEVCTEITVANVASNVRHTYGAGWFEEMFTKKLLREVQ